MKTIWTIITNHKEILALAQEVKTALEDRAVSSEEARNVSQNLISLLEKLGLLK